MNDFTKLERATLRRNALSVYPYIKKRDNLQAKIDSIQSEIDRLNQTIDNIDAGTITITGGYRTEEIIRKVMYNTGKVNENGTPIIVSKYEFIYGDSIIPNNTEDTNTDTNTNTGSDLDIDKLAGDIEVNEDPNLPPESTDSNIPNDTTGNWDFNVGTTDTIQ